MSANTETPLENVSILDDIEKRVSEIFSAQKSEVEQSLVERIKREKEEAQRRIDAVNQEFAQVRGFLDEHKAAMAELQTVEEHLRGEIRGHFERAVNYQKMMEHAAVLAGGELEKIGGLNDEIEKVRVKAESIYAGLKQRLSGYAGIIAQIPAPAGRPEGEMDWSAEIDKLRRVRDLLATLRPAGLFDDDAGEPSGPDASAPEPEQASPAAETAAEELAASLGLVGPEEDGVRDDIEFAAGSAADIPSIQDVQAAAEPVEETAPAPAAEPEVGPEPVDETVETPAAQADGCQFAAPPAHDNARVLESLARSAGPSPSTTASRSRSTLRRQAHSSTPTRSWPRSPRSSRPPTSSTPS